MKFVMYNGRKTPVLTVNAPATFTKGELEGIKGKLVAYNAEDLEIVVSLVNGTLVTTTAEYITQEED